VPLLGKFMILNSCHIPQPFLSVYSTRVSCNALQVEFNIPVDWAINTLSRVARSDAISNIKTNNTHFYTEQNPVITTF
jgi:hypothetical protein